MYSTYVPMSRKHKRREDRSATYKPAVCIVKRTDLLQNPTSTVTSFILRFGMKNDLFIGASGQRLML